MPPALPVAAAPSFPRWPIGLFILPGGFLALRVLHAACHLVSVCWWVTQRCAYQSSNMVKPQHRFISLECQAFSFVLLVWLGYIVSFWLSRTSGI